MGLHGSPPDDIILRQVPGHTLYLILLFIMASGGFKTDINGLPSWGVSMARHGMVVIKAGLSRMLYCVC